MNGRKECIMRLAERYLDGSATGPEEMRLKKLISETPREELPEELAALSVMLEGFSALGEESAPERSGTQPVRRSGKKWMKALIPATAAAAAAALAVFFSSRSIYGYDADGRPIRSSGKALAQAECLQILSELEISFDMAGDLEGLLGGPDMNEENATNQE